MRGTGNLSIELIPEDHDNYRVILANGDQTKVLASGLNFEYAFCSAEDYAKENRHLFIVSDRGASWRNQPISKKQITCISKFGYRAGIEKLTRGQASDLISSGTLKRAG